MRGMHTPRALDSAPRPKALAPWVALALAAHFALLWPGSDAPWRPSSQVPAAPVLQVRATAAAPPQALPGRDLVPTQWPTPTTRARASRPAPVTPLVAAPAASPTASAAPAPPAAVVVELPNAARWTYRLLHESSEGEAWLDWQREGNQYRLTLDRRTTERSLPQWRSQGLVGESGLASQRFAVQRGRAGQRVIHDAGSSPPPLLQDRLSWMLQLPALLRARPDASTLELDVVDWRGRTQPWRFERLGDAPSTRPDGETRLTQHWRRVPQGQAQAEIELWLDPADGYRPLRILHKVLGDERWELLWIPTDSAPNP
jgi:hypothetical protein